MGLGKLGGTCNEISVTSHIGVGSMAGWSCDAIMTSELARSWWAEPLLATMSFSTFIGLFRAAEGRTWRASNAAHPLTIAGILSLITYWLGVGLWVSVVPKPVAQPVGCPRSTHEFLYLIAEVVAGIVGYDFLLFFMHMLMHSSPTICHVFGHLGHHAHDDGSGGACRTTNHSLLDGCVQVIVNIFCQRHTPWGTAKSRVARWLHNVIVIEMLVESHSESAHPRIARRLFSGVAKHHLHHRHQGPPYQQFFGYLDDWLMPAVKKWHGSQRS